MVAEAEIFEVVKMKKQVDRTRLFMVSIDNTQHFK